VDSLIELAEGKSEDWLRIIWGKYAREQATKGEDIPSINLGGGGLGGRGILGGGGL
jgi:hypothetical protein